MDKYELISYGHTTDSCCGKSYRIETWTFRVPDEVCNAWWACRPRTVDDLMEEGNSVEQAANIVIHRAQRREDLKADMMRALKIPGEADYIHVKQIISEVFCIARISCEE